MPQQSVRNFAILAHVDAGKTTLSERILFTAGEVMHPGNVEDGLATLDYLPEEKEKGITIEAGVAHFVWKDTWFNFIDTPGHIDFGAEVDMALAAVEGAVLVVSATAGVETQTLGAWKKLRDRDVTTFLFLNKLDMDGLGWEDTIVGMDQSFGRQPLLMAWPHLQNGVLAGIWDVLTGTLLVADAAGKEVPASQSHQKTASQSPLPPPELVTLRREIAEAASQVDDSILADLLEGREISTATLVKALRELFAQGSHVPCWCGSALRNIGVRLLMTGLSLFLPASKDLPAGWLGKVVRLRHLRQLGEVALFKAAMDCQAKDWPQGMTFHRITGEWMTPADKIRKHDFYALKAEGSRLALGQWIRPDGTVAQAPKEYKGWDIQGQYQPLLQTQVECLDPEQGPQVESAISLLSRMDPAFQVRYLQDSGAWLFLTVGELHLEILLSRLQREFHCDVRSSEPEVQYHERLIRGIGPGENTLQAGPHKVDVSLWLNPTSEPERTTINTIQYTQDLEPHYQEAVRAAVDDASSEGIRGKGILVGVQVVVERLVASADCPIPFIKKAVSDAIRLLVKPEDIEVFEPHMECEVECPPEFGGVILGELQSRHAQIAEVGGDGKNLKIICTLPLKKTFGYSTIVRSISKGTASYALRYSGYQLLA